MIRHQIETMIADRNRAALQSTLAVSASVLAIAQRMTKLKKSVTRTVLRSKTKVNKAVSKP